MISSMRISRSSSAVVSAWLIAACLSGCVVSRPESTLPPGAPPPGETPPGSTPPAPGPGEAQPPPSERPPAQGPRQFRLGPAATALVPQAHAQAGSGQFGQAAAALSPRIRRTVMRSLAALAAVCLSGAALADTSIRYSVLFDGRPGGSEVVTVRGDGRVDVDMSYRNNGRGPDIKEHSRFAPDGT